MPQAGGVEAGGRCDGKAAILLDHIEPVHLAALLAQQTMVVIG
jgi:hypothetical protein